MRIKERSLDYHGRIQVKVVKNFWAGSHWTEINDQIITKRILSSADFSENWKDNSGFDVVYLDPFRNNSVDWLTSILYQFILLKCKWGELGSCLN